MFLSAFGDDEHQIIQFGNACSIEGLSDTPFSKALVNVDSKPKLRFLGGKVSPISRGGKEETKFGKSDNWKSTDQSNYHPTCVQNLVRILVEALIAST